MQQWIVQGHVTLFEFLIGSFNCHGNQDGSSFDQDGGAITSDGWIRSCDLN